MDTEILEILKTKQRRFPVMIAACLLLIILNVAGDSLSVWLTLPVWLDTSGTIIAGYFFGPIAGGVVGLITHLLICLKDHSQTWLYAVANMSIGIAVAVSRKRGYLRDLFGYCNVAVLLMVISVSVSFPDTVFLKGNVVGNVWGYNIAVALREEGIPNGFAVLFGEVLTDFVDKVILMYALYFSISHYHFIRSKERVKLEWINFPTFLLLPVVIGETVVRSRYHGNFIDSAYFKNYIIVVMIVLFLWMVWFVSTAMQRKTEKEHAQELDVSRMVLTAFSGNYQNVYLINLKEDTAAVIKQDGYTPHAIEYAARNTLSYSKSIAAYIHERVAQEDQERVQQFVIPESIVENLKDQEECRVFYHVLENGTRHDYEVRIIKTVQEGIYVVGFSNIDGVIAEESQRQKLYAQMDFLQDRTKMLQNMVMTIARLVDAKDVYTAKHSTRVTKYSLAIGQKMGLDAETMQNLERSALLHDIGKVAIPDGVLTKKGKLSKEEFQMMKSHPVFGYDILKDLDPGTQIGEGARYHHERYDGKGYPDGLKGEEIPLFGRIIAIADAYDAMSSNRIYRRKCDDAYILEELRKGRGTQFDPKICDIFLSLLEEGRVTAEKEENHTMTLEKAYEKFGGRYLVIHQRLKKDARILEYLEDFLEDEEFEKLKRAIAINDDRVAFQAVHTLKGISMNLDMVNLEKICISLTENLRNSPINALTMGLFEQLEKEYLEICGVIRELLSETKEQQPEGNVL